MIGIIPAAGAGERIQPLGCSKELLPVGSRLVGGVERPKAVSEYLVERMIAAGAGMRDTNLRDAGRDSLESELWAAGVVTPLLKRAFGRARPIQNEGSHSFHPLNGHFESFPSGHSTNAFAFATAIAGHYDGWVVPTIVYTIATGVAVSRVNDHVHFPSDVVAGALIGHAVAKGIVARHTGRKVAWQALPLIDRKTVGMMIAVGPR